MCKFNAEKYNKGTLQKSFCFPSKIYAIHHKHFSIKVSLIYNLIDDVPAQGIAQFCVLNYDDFVYFVGSQMQEQSSIRRLKVTKENSKWEEMAPMLIQHMYMGAAMFGNMIVEAGGEDDRKSVMNSAEIYDQSRNQWQAISSLNQKRFTHVLVTCEGSVYALGGSKEDICDFDNDDIDFDAISLSSVEKLSDVKWEMASCSTNVYSKRVIGCCDVQRKNLCNWWF